MLVLGSEVEGNIVVRFGVEPNTYTCRPGASPTDQKSCINTIPMYATRTYPCTTDTDPYSKKSVTSRSLRVSAHERRIALNLPNGKRPPVLHPPGPVPPIAKRRIDVGAADQGDGLAVGVSQLAAGRRVAAAGVESEGGVGAREGGRLGVGLAQVGREQLGRHPAEEVGGGVVEEVGF